MCSGQSSIGIVFDLILLIIEFCIECSIFMGTQPILHIADPVLVKLVLVTEFNKFIDRRDLRTYHEVVNQNLFNSRGEQWKRIRTIVSSTFTSSKLKKLYVLVRRCLQDYLEHLEELVGREEGLQVKQMHENFTMDVIASCAFATQTNAAKDPNNKFTRMGRKVFHFKVIKTFSALVLPKAVNNFLNIKTVMDHQANEWIINLSKHMIERRRKSGEKRNDFLQLLIDASADDSKTDDNEMESHYIDKGINLTLS